MTRPCCSLPAGHTPSFSTVPPRTSSTYLPSSQTTRTISTSVSEAANSAYSVGVRPDWRLFKLVYASLLGADQPEVKSRCWSRGSALDLTEVLRKIAKEKDKGKKRKRDEGLEPAEGRSGGDFEGEAGVDDRGAADVAEAMADPQVSFEWGLED